MPSKVTIGYMEPNDRPYILDSFLRSYKDSPYAQGVHPNILIQLMDGLLSAWQVRVARDEDGKMILGWIVYRDSHTVAYGYVRKSFRKLGIFRSLISAAELDPKRICTDVAFYDPTSGHFDVWGVYFRPYLPLEVPNAIMKFAGAL